MLHFIQVFFFYIVNTNRIEFIDDMNFTFSQDRKIRISKITTYSFYEMPEFF